jgi:hypothetical protein
VVGESACSHHDALGCRLGSPAASPTFVLWGDSHGAMFASHVSKLARSAGKSGYWVGRGGCPPLVEYDGRSTRPVAKCHAANAMLLRILDETPTIRHIVLAARWSLYSELEQQSGETLRVGYLGHRSVDDARAALNDGLQSTLGRLSANGRTVTLIAPVPELSIDNKQRMVRAAMVGITFEHREAAATYDRHQSFILSLLQKVATRPGVRVVYPHRSFCDGHTCVAAMNGVPLYTDLNHLNANGIAVMADVLADAFEFPLAISSD